MTHGSKYLVWDHFCYSGDTPRQFTLRQHPSFGGTKNMRLIPFFCEVQFCCFLNTATLGVICQSCCMFNSAKICVKCKSSRVQQELWFSPRQEQSQVLVPAFTRNEWSLHFHKMLGRHPTPAHISLQVTKMVKILNAKCKNSQYYKHVQLICYIKCHQIQVST